MVMNNYRYSQWDGTQEAFEPSEEDIMGEMADDLMNHGDLRRSLRNLFQRGLQDQSGQRMQGLRDMLEQLRNRRQEQLQQYNLDSVLDDLKEKLKQITETEREGIDRRLEEARQQQAQSSSEDAADKEKLMRLLEERAARNKEKLDNLPLNLGGAVKELSDYDFMDPEAQRQFQELMDLLKQRVLENTFQDLRQQIQSMSSEDMDAMGQMLHDLNQMLQDQMQGLPPDFEGFMDRYGDMFDPDQPQSLEELMESLQRQMGQAQSLMDSMSPEKRQELQELMDGALDPETMNEMAQLAAAMNAPPETMARLLDTRVEQQ